MSDQRIAASPRGWRPPEASDTALANFLKDARKANSTWSDQKIVKTVKVAWYRNKAEVTEERLMRLLNGQGRLAAQNPSKPATLPRGAGEAAMARPWKKIGAVDGTNTSIIYEGRPFTVWEHEDGRRLVMPNLPNPNDPNALGFQVDPNLDNRLNNG